MSNKTRRRRGKSKATKNISKASTDVKGAKGLNPTKGVGTAGMGYYQEMLRRIQPFELQWPYSMETFEAMKNDDAIASVLNLTYVLIERAFSAYTIKYNKASEASEKAKDFLDFCFNNLDGQSFSQVIRNAETFKEKGFSILEKVYKRMDSGEFNGMWKISQLANRPQASLDRTTPFEIMAGGRRIKSARQNTQYFQNFFNNNLFINPSDMTGKGYKIIPRKKFMLFGEQATDSTPFGQPLFRACYKLWKEKVLLEDLEVNGASKDLAGIIDLSIPGAILDKAAADPSSEEAVMVDDLLTTAANVHAGEQAYFVRPSDLQDGSTSVQDYGIKLLGLEGSGRQFTPGDMIQQRRKAIFDVWGAGHTISGEGSVSYNSAEVQNSLHLHYVKRDIQVIEDVINNDLIPQLLNGLNDFNLPFKDLPKIVAGEIDKISIDEVSKMVQRVISVNGLVPTKDNIIHYHKLLGFDTSMMENLSEKELIEQMNAITKGSSRAGESGGTSGTGNTQNVVGGDNNLENKSLGPFRVDKKGVYQEDNDGLKVYTPLDSLPEELKDGFNIG